MDTTKSRYRGGGSLQQEHGSVFNQPSSLMVELAEKLVHEIDFADWAVFAKMDLILPLGNPSSKGSKPSWSM